MTSPGINIEAIRERQAMHDRAQLLKVTSPEELAQIFDSDDIKAVDEYQRATFDQDPEAEAGRLPSSRQRGGAPKVPAGLGALIRTPLPPNFSDKYRGQTHLLTHNKSEYDAEFERLLGEDPIIQAALPFTKSSDPFRNAETLDVVRSRRTIRAFLRSLGGSAVRPAVEETTPAQK